MNKPFEFAFPLHVEGEPARLILGGFFIVVVVLVVELAWIGVPRSCNRRDSSDPRLVAIGVIKERQIPPFPCRRG